MNGMVVDSWPYVIAAFAVTWLVLIGYSIRLMRMDGVRAHSSSSSGPKV